MEIKKGYFEQSPDLSPPPVDVSELSGIPAADRRRVVELARRIFPTVTTWAQPYPVILPERIPSVCLACAAMCPDADIEAVIAITNLSLVIFALDDVVDSVIGNQSDEQIEAVLSLYTEVVHSRGVTNQLYSQQMLESGFSQFNIEVLTTGPDYKESNLPAWLQVTNSLMRFCRELDKVTVNYELFNQYFELVMDGMRQELKWRQKFEQLGYYPDWQTYINYAKKSIAVPAVLSALLALTVKKPLEVLTEPELAAQADTNLSRLINDLIFTGAMSVRLSNDIISYKRELELEKKANGIFVLMHELGLNESEARKETLGRIDQFNLTLAQKLIPKFSEWVWLESWASSALRLAVFSKDWYQVREFHDFPKEMLVNLTS